MPEIVYIGLLGLNSKAQVMFFLILSLGLAGAALILGLKNPIWLGLCPAMLGAAYWYYYCMDWVDKNSNWD